MNKFAALIAAGVVVAGGSTAAYSLASTPSSTPSQARPVLGASQAPRSGHTDDIVDTTPDAHGRQQDSRKQTEPGDGRGNHVEPGDDRGNHAEPGDDRGNHAEPGDDRGNHAEPGDDNGHHRRGDDGGNGGRRSGDDSGSGHRGSDGHGGHGHSDDD